MVGCSLGVAPAEVRKGENRSGKPLSVQPLQGAFAPTHQLVAPFHLRLAQSPRVFGPLQPLSLRQSPSCPKVVAHGWLLLGQVLWIVDPK